MTNILWSLLAFIISIGLLTAVHEFGHLWVARLCCVKVERFSIGFGKCLWKRVDKFKTEYIIALIPLGGYIKMLGERDCLSSEYHHQYFNNKPLLQRVAIVSAGPVANFLFAMLAYWLVFIIGIVSVRPIISEVIPKSVAAQGGITSGSEIKYVADVMTSNWDEVRLALISQIGTKITTISFVPFGSHNITKKIIDLTNWRYEPDTEDPVVSLGIIPTGPNIDPVLTEVQQDSAAQQAGLQVGDRIIKIDGSLFQKWGTLVNQIKKNPNKKISIEVERNGRIEVLQLIPKSKSLGKNKIEGFAGFAPTVTSLPKEYESIIRYRPFVAINKAIKKTWQLMKITASMTLKLITGDIKISNLGGPISIAQSAKISAEYGLAYYLMFLSLISINLGIINLFPLPVLDGGRLLFLAIESIQGKPVSKRVQSVSDRICSMLMLVLMGIAFFNDLSRF
ncbi:sigma E protease regulator RseP [Candidatus Profftia tarda]|uniref:Zinc metalloprotease n=1 Tax=Candidatus Profftia tarda TaxID=1177216 RepID=A0A8E4F074_9ENTR|nr:sigma E protease regulator RseP [Candidatus Profftia tarda]CAD6510390.1 Protease RseP [Candidatus Profftia tarda]